MKIAIMQPYLFPYIGYFQLINAVDKFIFYDDVNFIKQGWINRNNILVVGNKYVFSLPIEQISSFKKINETKINLNIYKKSKQKLLKTIQQSYKKAPFYEDVMILIENVLNFESKYISDFAKQSIIGVCTFLEIKTEIIKSSEIYNNDNLKSVNRVIDICKKEVATHYLNPIGGIELYNKQKFKEQNLELNFLKSKEVIYKQFNNLFIPNLSIIDVMMFNSKDEIKQMLLEYELV
ncbi:MAG: WbqC family protein [Bacteroidales bacterium]|nr:WbqC family protein [Bacteroidales bacterium]